MVLVIEWGVLPLAEARVRSGRDAVSRVAVLAVQDQQSDQATTQLTSALHAALQSRGVQLVPPAQVSALRQYHREATSALPPEVQTLTRVLTSAKGHFLHFENTAALAEAERVVQAFGQAPQWLAEHGQLFVDALLIQAMVYHSQRRVDRLPAVMTTLARTAPQYQLPEREYPPSLRQHFAEAVAARRAAGVAALRVSSSPSAAEVRLNGVRVGLTPLQLDALPAGPYAVALVASHYEARARAVELQAGAAERVQVSLRPRAVAPAEAGAEPGASATDLVAEGVRAGRLAHADQVVLVDVDQGADRRGEIALRVVDARHGVGQAPLLVRFDRDRGALHARLAELVPHIATQLERSAEGRGTVTTAVAASDPAALQRKRRWSPWLWAGLGALVLGGTVTGLVLSSGSSAPRPGVVVVRFE